MADWLEVIGITIDNDGESECRHTIHGRVFRISMPSSYGLPRSALKIAPFLNVVGSLGFCATYTILFVDSFAGGMALVYLK